MWVKAPVWQPLCLSGHLIWCVIKVTVQQVPTLSVWTLEIQLLCLLNSPLVRRANQTHTCLTTLNPALLFLQMCPGLLCPVLWQVKWNCRFSTRVTSFSLWWCTLEAWWVSGITRSTNVTVSAHVEKMLSWCSLVWYGSSSSNPCRMEQILIHMSNCTSYQTLRKPVKGRQKRPGEHATPLTMRWWGNSIITWLCSVQQWVVVVLFMNNTALFY